MGTLSPAPNTHTYTHTLSVSVSLSLCLSLCLSLSLSLSLSLFLSQLGELESFQLGEQVGCWEGHTWRNEDFLWVTGLDL